MGRKIILNANYSGKDISGNRRILRNE